ncbi:helix-turn-helix domain-containing protein, partial [Microbacterium sp.]|uniref:helix-turn-helix domain-containing protein n=1 Tax=Microbacterium sp. TaxID=51671 RepID=UPI003F97D4C5
MVTDAEERPRKNRGPAAAAENRRALIAAARAVFADGGFAVPFSAIARRAGVGQGSLYRHFPTKIALAAAVFDDDID